MSPRSVISTVPANTTSVRQQTVMRANAANDGSPVEETNAQSSVSFNTAMLFQNNGQTGEQEDDSSKGRTLVEYVGSSQSFANIVEESVRASGSGQGGAVVRRGFSGYVTRAINIYESNARVIHGSGPDPRGSTVSLAL